MKLLRTVRQALTLGLVVVAGPAFGQDGPLTTLMRPQLSGGAGALSRHDQLFGETPLTNSDRLAGEDSLSGQQTSRGRPAADPANPGRPGEEAAACNAARRRPTAPALASGGSGPGEYGRFVDSGRTASATPPGSTPRPSSAAPGDRPLFGGTDRPLWRDGAPSATGPASPHASASSGTRASQAGARGGGAAGGVQAGDATGESRDVAPAPGVDRPLWAETGETPVAAVDPCAGASTQRAGGVGQPTQTLFFGTVPAR